MNPIRIFASPWESADSFRSEQVDELLLAEGAWRRHALSAAIHRSRIRQVSSPRASPRFLAEPAADE